MPPPERQDTHILARTRSVCPVCLASLPAELVCEAGADVVCIRRRCPEHGEFSVPVWRGEPSFATWRRPKQPASGLRRETPTTKGCPHDCGRCPEHGQYACTVLFEITGNCNLTCPVCFADAGKPGAAALPSLAVLAGQLRWIKEHAGNIVLQLSGGEPTLHPDLPELVRLGKELFPAVQLNTNGILLAERPDLAQILAESGLSWVFLQCDGTTDDINVALRGRPLLEKKLRAVENCGAAGLSVVLVPTVAKGVNDHDLGNLLRMGISLAPVVRGLHLQPMTGAGRNLLAGQPPHSAGLTLPETLTAICAQSGGLMRPEHATPPGCEHERCSFHCRYHITPSGGLAHIHGEAPCCGVERGVSRGCRDDGPAPYDAAAKEETQRAIGTILRSWQGEAQTHSTVPAAGQDAFDAFIAKARARSFSVTCMAFQDAMNIDLQRLQGCCVHVFSPPGRLIPFCARNLTALDGRALHPREWA